MMFVVGIVVLLTLLLAAGLVQITLLLWEPWRRKKPDEETILNGAITCCNTMGTCEGCRFEKVTADGRVRCRLAGPPYDWDLRGWKGS